LFRFVTPFKVSKTILFEALESTPEINKKIYTKDRKKLEYVILVPIQRLVHIELVVWEYIARSILSKKGRKRKLRIS
jgi:hypothetical protein